MIPFVDRIRITFTSLSHIEGFVMIFATSIFLFLPFLLATATLCGHLYSEIHRLLFFAALF